MIEVDIQEMPVAFIFINAEVGSEQEVVKELRKIESVKEAHVIYGIYDVVAKVEAETTDKLREAITRKVRKVNKIRSTLTMTVIK